MTLLDWLLILGLNGSVIVYAIFKSRDTKTSSDWFLARRSLPWWVVGLSMYATAIDASDMVADSGGAYRFGVSMFVFNWVGVVAGWFLMAHFIAIPMYRLGMYTNAEYLEARFGPASRVVSAVIQVLYRTVVMAIIGTTVFLTLTIVVDWTDTQAWGAVVAIAALATFYTMLGGLQSVAITDAFQSFIMLAASALLFGVVYLNIGGWSGLTEKLEFANGAAVAEQALRVGSAQIDETDTSNYTPDQVSALLRLGGRYDAESNRIVQRTPGWLVAVYFAIAGLAYSIVNHTQSMRMFRRARSEWDLKMSIVLAGGVMIVVTFLNLSLGIFGRALYDLSGPNVDHVFPNLVRDYSVQYVGLRGLVVAGILAASFSTYDSIGSTLSALLTRDVYARIFVRNRDDHHYVQVGRWLTPLIIFGSFAYVPFLLHEGMILFYLNVVGAFVVPLLTIYLMGSFTRVSRHSAIPGLLIGVGYGVCHLLSRMVATSWGIAILPAFMANNYAAFPICMLITAGSMVVVSVVCGWETSDGLRVSGNAGWLESSQKQLQGLLDDGDKSQGSVTTLILGIAVVALGFVLSFVVFW